MTWIRTEPDDPEVAAARKELYEAFPSEYGQDSERLPPLVRADSITLAHSLIPGVMKHFFLALAELLDPRLPLTRREHELIATAVSTLNSCHY
jgi:hypothetical protein